MVETALIGNIESVEAGEGFVHLSGWIARSNRAKLDGTLTLTIQDGETILIDELHYRTDLADAGIADGVAGFSIAAPISKLNSSALITGAMGADVFVFPALPVSPFKPCAGIDQVEGGLFRGWVFDPRLTLLGLLPRLRIDDRVEIILAAKEMRRDVILGSSGGLPALGFVISYDDVVAAMPAGMIAESIFDGKQHQIAVHSGDECLVSLTENLPIYDSPVYDPPSMPETPEILRSETPVRVVTSRAAPAKKAATSKGTLLTVRIEKILRSADRLLMTGWAARPDQSAITDPLRFELGAGEAVDVAGLDLRPDVKTKGIADGIAGFTIVFDLPEAGGLPPKLKVSVPSQGTSEDFLIDPALVVASSDYARLRAVNGSDIIGTFVRLDSHQVQKQISLRFFGQSLIEATTLDHEAVERVWSSGGVMRAGIRVPRAEWLMKLRGLDPFFVLPKTRRGSVELMRGDETIVKAEFALKNAFKGRLETVQPNYISGWIVDPDQTSAPAEFEVLIDGVPYLRERAKRRRDDLIEKGIVESGGGFRLSIDNPSADQSEITISVVPAFTGEALSGCSGAIAMPPAQRVQHGSIYARLAEARTRGVSIIVPIYNAAEDLEICLESLVRNTDYACRLILIDDSSPDSRIGEILHRYERFRNIEIYRNEVNLGFTRTVNRGIALAREDDVIFLNSDTIVTPGWLQGLRIAAYSDARIATVTAVSNNANVFNVREPGTDNAYPPGLDADGFSRLIRRASLNSYPKVPTGNGFCLYVRRDCIDVIGPLDEQAFPVGYGEENDFSMRALRAGFQHVIDDRTFVYHKRSASFGEAKAAHYMAGREVISKRYPEYQKLISVFNTSSDILGMRWRVRKAIKDFTQTYEIPRPRVAFVISTQTGGTPQTNRDLMIALSDRYEPWVLRCDTQHIELYRYAAEGDVLVEKRKLRNKIEPATHRSHEYNDQIADLLIHYGFECVHIRHLGWHGVDLPEICQTLGIPVAFSLHDFYTVCPTIKLLDQNGVFCKGSCTSTEGDCAVELWDAKDIPPLKNKFITRWRELFSYTFSFCDAFVTTAHSAKELFVSAYPELANADFRVIPHGRSFQDNSISCAFPSAHKLLKVLVPGNISPAKGAELIANIVELDVERRIEFHILGDAGKLKPGKGIKVHGRYKRDEFGALVQAIKPHIGAVFSIWPETYCHTLTEMWSSGIPVLGIDVGAVGERIASHGGGWLATLGSSAESVYEILLNIRKTPSEHKQKVNEIIDWQNGYAKAFTTDFMAVKYDALYREIRQRRSAFAPLESGSTKPIEVALISSMMSMETQIAILPAWATNVAHSRQVFWHVGEEWSVLNESHATFDAVFLDACGMQPDACAGIMESAARRGLPVDVFFDQRSLTTDKSDLPAKVEDLSWLINARFVFVASRLEADHIERYNANVHVIDLGKPMSVSSDASYSI